MTTGPASRSRHGRQVRLVEVGEAGQARIGRARAVVTTRGLAAWVETRYLAGAGVSALTVPSTELAHAARAVDGDVVVEVAAPAVEPPASDLALEELGLRDPALEELGLRDPAARAVAAGALAALAVLRGTIGGGAS